MQVLWRQVSSWGVSNVFTGAGTALQLRVNTERARKDRVESHESKSRLRCDALGGLTA